MSNPKYKNILNEFELYLNDLKAYSNVLKYTTESKLIMGHQIAERDRMRETLVRKTGVLKGLIIELTGKQYVSNLLIGRMDMWSESFNTTRYTKAKDTLTFCINAVNEAIGILSDDITKGKRDAQTGELLTKSDVSGSKQLEVLIEKAKWGNIEREFGVTKTAFGKRINFIKDPFKREIIFRDVEQAFDLASLGFSKPAVILAGGVIEELLRLYLEQKDISPQKPLKKDFNGYIQTCVQNRLLKDSVSHLSDSVRGFRNLVHLSAEETRKHTISKPTAKGAVSSIFTIANDF